MKMWAEMPYLEFLFHFCSVSKMTEDYFLMPVSSRYPCEVLDMAEGASQHHTDYEHTAGLKKGKLLPSGLKWVMSL